MKMKDEGKTLKDFNRREYEVFKIYQAYNTANKHKMIPIPICKIPNKYK